MNRSTTLIAAGLITGLTLFATACSGAAGSSDSAGSSGDSSASSGTSGNGSGSGSGSGADADKALKIRKCLRDQGLDAPDPKAGEDPRGMTMGGGGDPEKTAAALKKCGVTPPGSGPEVSQAQKDKALKQAKCMREHGFDVADPTFNGNAMTGLAVPEGADADAFVKQLNKCSG
ncbi:hypothetical protein ACN20G_26270 [Streptomyces sp. BI20]|uniref:hypothetical protein n=1 Tax=Streptomyces sp. BI20 TaxID=3403460 RepID=UPI003C74174E